MSLIEWITAVHWRNSLDLISGYRSDADLLNKLYKIIEPGENLLYIILRVSHLFSLTNPNMDLAWCATLKYGSDFFVWPLLSTEVQL